jgi:predicted secreted protein
MDSGLYPRYILNLDEGSVSMAEHIQQKSGVVMISAIFFMIILFTGCVFGDPKPKDMPAPTQCQKTLELENATVNEMQNASTVCTNMESTFTLRLNENSRTGYQWQVTASPELQVIDDGVSWYDENNLPTRMVGIKGIHEWKITAKKPGIQTIKAILRRPEGVTGSESLFYLNVIVK